MLMLTHTYLLQRILGVRAFDSNDLDAYVYNIVPDLLTIHPDITSQQTHKIKRLLHVPERYPKAAYIMFHQPTAPAISQDSPNRAYKYL